MILKFKIIVAIMLYLTSICYNFMYFWPSGHCICTASLSKFDQNCRIYISCVLELHSSLKSTFVHDANNTWQLVLV